MSMTIDNADDDNGPLEFTVQVIRHRPNKETRVLEPWPEATIHLHLNGAVRFTGNAGKAYGPMQQAFESTLAEFARQSAGLITRQIAAQADAKL